MYRSKIIFSKPSKKAWKYEDDLQYEVFETIAEKLFKETIARQIEMPEEIFDPAFLLEVTKETILPELAQRLVNSDFGQGFIAGTVAHVMLQEELDEEDD